MYNFFEILEQRHKGNEKAQIICFDDNNNSFKLLGNNSSKFYPLNLDLFYTLLVYVLSVFLSIKNQFVLNVF